MRRFTAVVLPLMLAVFMSGSAAFAQNVHFKGGRNAGPTFRDLGTQLQICLALAGLSNEDVIIHLDVVGTGTTECRNPGNGSLVPGINKVPIEVDADATIDSSQIKNGNLNVCLTTDEPMEVSAREAGCPNNNWEATITDVEFEQVTLSVEQGGQTVLGPFTYNL